MKRDDLNIRRDRIIALLTENQELSARDLAAQLGVSVQTIRADLRDLDAAALVQRRNGAVRLRQQSENIAYLPRVGASRLAKQQIALVVKNLVKDGARVALGTGTTVEQCARMLAIRQNLFVATNSIHAVHALQNAPGAVVELAGGTVRLRDLDLIGAASAGFFSRFRMEQAIFSCGGLSEGGEVLDYNAAEIVARQSITECARERILVVDSAKFGRDLPCRMGHLWEYEVVVTNAPLSADIRDRCAATGCRIIAAEAE
ncbi:DeoR/GlpR family DNA-binding transcription regulator [Epibacterium sp. MM17-32]|uniref:DeoR/GlpR family DNA-binding transcription regulator n=1 Tax=Epibacterium sp. MM17-32 TaxID=2917734 RepID=UPI001EF40FBC|nr:DeoR/GlpR family DNA-binding transcription regulator [Epibacterium sp. MM17-32]MCG7629124.1 DeoR/GlpR family DNA-binding transcription regulator [Epibacterium sp. MM17-32]